MIDVIGTLMAAFAGAGFAFILENWQRKRAERNKRVGYGRIAIFVLGRYRNSLIVFRNQIIDPIRNQGWNILCIPATYPMLINNLAFNVESLDFLMSKKQGILLQKLFLEEDGIRTVNLLIDVRLKLHTTMVQPKLEAAGLKSYSCWTDKVMREVLGEQLFVTFCGNTKQLVEMTDRTIESMQEMDKELRVALKKMFPDKDFIEFEEVNKGKS